ncbi:MAG: CofH family radical SAM protein, partial [Rikenellaceae bacterium]
MIIPDDVDKRLKNIIEDIYAGKRLSLEQGEYLYNGAPMSLLSQLAIYVKRRKSSNKVFYNRNFHIEPTNICIYNCKFCSYRKSLNSSEAWCMSNEQVLQYAKEHYHPDITEVHLVGGVHPNATLESYGTIIKTLRDYLPSKVAIKAFSAIEHIYVIEKAGLSYTDGIKYLMDCGMGSITGGGAEIFNSQLRSEICNDKASSEKWLALHRAAHQLGMKTAATMLYGHKETLSHKLEHLDILRKEQDISNGYNVFIPLKFRNRNNEMSHINECSLEDDLKTIALSRIMLDNIDHIKAYPPALGVNNLPSAITFGADDIDGTVNDTTKIYSMAGAANDTILTEDKLRKVAS